MVQEEEQILICDLRSMDERGLVAAISMIAYHLKGRSRSHLVIDTYQDIPYRAGTPL